MRLDIHELIETAVGSLERARIASSDEELLVSVEDPQRFATTLRAVAVGLQRELPSSDLVISTSYVSGVAPGREVYTRVRIAPNPNYDLSGPDQWKPHPSVVAPVRALEQIVSDSGGEFHASRWSVDVRLPLAPEAKRPTRESFVRVDRGCWETAYQVKLERTSWSSLRHEVFRVAGWAERIARYARARELDFVLCPGVGLSVDPWIFAHATLRVIALDRALTAIKSLAHPSMLPRIYSSGAKDDWDIEQRCMYSGGANPAEFEAMPKLEDAETEEELRRHILFTVGDSLQLPLADDSVDVVFACNTLPRDVYDEPRRLETKSALTSAASRALRWLGCASPTPSAALKVDRRAERERMLVEWSRVLRPGGLAFVKMHNAYDIVWDARDFFLGLGWSEIDVAKPPDSPSPVGSFQAWSSSG